jgi:carboxyl-terminal processing protease
VEAAGGEGIGVPVVVLINEWTASAAEILAGALRDNGVGVLVGVTSFGKGTVQTPFEVGGGSVLRVTTERWLRPNKEQISGKGIEPDAVVSLPVVDETESASFWEGFTWNDPEDPRDTQLRRAVELLRQTLAEDGGS